MPKSNGQTLTEEPALDRRLAELKGQPAPDPDEFTLAHLALAFQLATKREQRARTDLTAAQSWRAEIERELALHLETQPGREVLAGHHSYSLSRMGAVLAMPTVYGYLVPIERPACLTADFQPASRLGEDQVPSDCHPTFDRSPSATVAAFQGD